MSWLNKESAIKSAFNYRHRGDKTNIPVLITDFDIKNLRVFEVYAGEWDDPTTWRAVERPMTDDEFALINRPHLQRHTPVGAALTTYEGRPVHVRGYVNRPKIVGDELRSDWCATLDIDEVKARHYAETGGEPPEDDFERFMLERSRIGK